MPALRGSLTYTRFFVDGELPESFHAPFMKAIRLRTMKPLEADEDVNERSGWCAVGDAFGLELGHEDVFYNEFLNLGFRTDRWVVPGPMLRAKMREAEAAYLAKKGRERLSRKEREELKTVVMRGLRKKLTPTTRSIDLSWSIEDGTVRFFSHAARPVAAMMELFQKTFGLRLVPESPYTLAARLGLSKGQEGAWQELEPTSLGRAE